MVTIPPGDDERFEHIPWEQITPVGNRNKLLYAIAGAILIAGLTAAAMRGGGSDGGPVPTPTSTGSAAVPTISTVAEAPKPTAVTSSPPSTATQTWSEADLMAFPAESLAAEAGAIAEWLASDYFTIDGGPEIAEQLTRVLPAGSALPVAPSGSRSYVEWARAVSVQESAPGIYKVLVVVRRLGGAGGEGYRRLDPIGVVITLVWTEEGWSVIDLPVIAEAPSLVQAPAWSETEVPAEIATAAAASTGGQVVAGLQVGESWRLVVQVTDPTGMSWPLVVWSDLAGNRIPIPALPVQP